MGRSKQRNEKTGKQTQRDSAVDPRIMERTLAELNSAVDRMESGAGTPEDFKLIRGVTATLCFLSVEIKAKRASIRRLVTMLFGFTSESTAKVCPPKDAPATPGDSQPKVPKEKKPGHGRKGADAFPSAEKVHVAHDTLKAGDECPECPNGRVYPVIKPAVMVRIVGLSPLQATVIERERLRCNGCGEVFTAKAPEGTGTQKFDASATAMIGLLKYGTGAPFYRLAKLQEGLGVPLPASTQWGLVRKAAGDLDPVMDEMVRLAAQADVIHNDDTVMKLLERPDLQFGKKKRRAVYTTGIVARTRVRDVDRGIVLFLTGQQHAGENLAEVLRRRSEELAPPIQMCDALTANTKGAFSTIVAHCLAHARRRFVDVKKDFPEECRYLLETLRDVYINDANAKEMSPPERLKFHQDHSGPLMEALHLWLQDQIQAKKTEPNSGLGRAIAYMTKHWLPLTLFLREPKAPLDNNLCERALKRAILHRKNSMFYKTIAGARVGDTFMTLIHTAELNDANPFDYLVALQRNHALAEENPEEWMPWNYRKTLEAIEA